MKSLFLTFVPIALMGLSGCETPRGAVKASPLLEACADWTLLLGDSHECSYADGGALGPDRVRAEITQKVLVAGQTLPRKDYGLAVLLFDGDGSYQARKLHFTSFYEVRQGDKIFLVYAEDSKGTYTVEDNGVITLNTPWFSTCDERLQGSDKIYPHVLTERRKEPFRTTRPSKTSIVFAAQAWLGQFLGSSYWDGVIESRAGFPLPPFPKSKEPPLTYVFDGFQADIHYGCLEQGFAGFAGTLKEGLATVQEFRYRTGINPQDLRPGTRLIVSP